MTAETTDIRFACHCGQRLVVEASAAGMALACPNCQTELTIPTAPTPRNGTAGKESGERPAKAKRRKASPGGPSTAEMESELAAATAEIGRLEHELKAAVDEREHLYASVTHTQAELKAFQSERQQSKTDLANVRQRAAAVEAQLIRREQELAEAREALAALETHAADLDAALADEQQQSRLAFSELEQSRDALATSEAQVAAAETSIGQLTASAAEAGRELNEAKAQLLVAGEVAKRLDVAEEALRETHAKLLRADVENRALAAKFEQARAESEILRGDLKVTETGAELLSLRAKLAESETGRTDLTGRFASLEAELKTFREVEVKLRADLEIAQRSVADLSSKLETAAELRVAKDNEVLRGIIARQNTELTQNFREIHRLRRARFWLKIVYMLFGIGLLGVIAVALKVLPSAFDF